LNFKKLVSIVAIFTALLFSFGCSPQKKLEKIKSSGKIVVFTNANFPPFEYMKGKEVAGVDVELAKAIASELDVKLELKEADFDGLISSIAGGKGDVAISAITIDEAKKAEVDFSLPYIRSLQYLVLPKNSVICRMEDLAGKRVAAAIGYSGQIVIDKEVKTGVLAGKNTVVTYVNSAVEGSLELSRGKQDALIIDEYVAKKISSENSNFVAIPLVYSNGKEISEEYGVAVSKGNEDLLEIVNGVIKKLTAQDKFEDWVVEYSV
jgi:polar amino acid transport system substrate-binding protein